MNRQPSYGSRHRLQNPDHYSDRSKTLERIDGCWNGSASGPICYLQTVNTTKEDCGSIIEQVATVQFSTTPNLPDATTSLSNATTEPPWYTFWWIWLIVGVVTLSIILIVVAIIVFCCCRKKKKEEQDTEAADSSNSKSEKSTPKTPDSDERASHVDEPSQAEVDKPSQAAVDKPAQTAVDVTQRTPPSSPRNASAHLTPDFKNASVNVKPNKKS